MTVKVPDSYTQAVAAVLRDELLTSSLCSVDKPLVSYFATQQLANLCAEANQAIHGHRSEVEQSPGGSWICRTWLRKP